MVIKAFTRQTDSGWFCAQAQANSCGIEEGFSLTILFPLLMIIAVVILTSQLPPSQMHSGSYQAAHCHIRSFIPDYEFGLSQSKEVRF